MTHTGRVEHIRQQKVQKRPELVEIILQWGPSQQQTIGRLKLTRDLWQLRAEDKKESDSRKQKEGKDASEVFST